MIYLESSALVKLVAAEVEREALVRWLTLNPELRITSDLSRVEVIRACVRDYQDAVPAANLLLAGLQTLPLTAVILDRSGYVGPTTLRSLDAIHLASALTLASDLTAFVTYDHRLQIAAEAEHLPVVAPA